MWADVEIYIPHSTKDSGASYIANFTIFVAIGESPQNGLNGFLSVCVTPDFGDWRQSSLMHVLQEEYELPNIYVSFRFVESDGLYIGFIQFSDEEVDIFGMTYGG